MNQKRKRFWGSSPKFKQPKLTGPSTSNRFHPLSDLDDSDVMSLANEEFTEPVIKVPPIVIDNSHKFSDIIHLLGQKCKYKRMSIGTKIMPNSMVDFEEINKLLISKNYTFFTHAIQDRRKFKLMLFGLPQVGLNTIKEEFQTKHNIDPVSIKEIKTVKTNSDDALYMLEFNRSQISKREVRKIKYFCDIVVQWRNPLRSKRGPTQCSKCTMYGHGAANCHRKSACLGCGGDHDYAVCTLEKLPQNGPVIYKCHNCIKKNLKNVNHRADDIRCPCRKEYLEIRHKVTSKRKSSHTLQCADLETDFSEDELNMPTTSNEIPSKFSPQFSNSKRMSYSTMAKSRPPNDNNEDLSNEKILEIYFEALDALQKCKNKYDKMRVLGMMLKYVI